MKLRTSLLCVFLFSAATFAEEKRLPEAKFDKGHLKYVSGVPVLTLQGTPEEIGTQFGELALKPATKPLLGRVDSYMKQMGWEKQFPTMVKFAGFVFQAFPKNNRDEMTAACKHAQVDRNLMTALNTIPDLAKLGGCSTIVVAPGRSSTGGPLFGRLLDWPPFEELPEYSMVVVFRAKDKHAVAAVTFPILLGVLSGMNDAGLCLSINEITKSKDEAKTPDMNGVPMMFLFRKILEECATVEQAEKMLKEQKRTTMYCVTACDAKGGCVFEVTPKNVVRRDGLKEMCCCTNHFRTPELSVTERCQRYPKLEELQKADGKLGVAEVLKGLDAVNQGPATIQCMIFEPKERVLHLAYGGGKSATKRPLVKLELGPIFEGK